MILQVLKDGRSFIAYCAEHGDAKLFRNATNAKKYINNHNAVFHGEDES